MKPKRLISLLVAVCMMITMLPLSAVTAFAADTSSSTGTASSGGYKYEYKVNEDGTTATITNFLGPDDSANPVGSTSTGLYDIDIPETLDGHTVTGLGNYSFAYRYVDNSYYDIVSDKNPFGCSIRSVTIPKSVTSIGYKAFCYCENLQSLTFQGPIESMGDGAFEYCAKLDNVTIPQSVTSIGNYAFYKCSALTNVTIPQGVTSIGNFAFYECSALEKVNIPNGITSIGKSVFSGCSVLDNVNIPVGVTSIGREAFSSCRGLTNITIPKSVTSIGDSAFAHCTGLTSLTINNAATSIRDWAFYECPLTTTLELGENITTIGYKAFDSCGLKSVTIPKSVTSIGNGAFYSCRSLKTLSFGENSFGENIETNIKTIGDEAFRDCSALDNVTIPQSVTSIGTWAFESCDGLHSLTINGAITSMGKEAFYGCDQLRTLKLGANIETIGEGAFYRCWNLPNVTIPEKVKTIEPDTFADCSLLEYIMLPAGLNSFQDELRDCPADCVIYYKGYKTAADTLLAKNPVLQKDIQAGHNYLYLCDVTFDANGGNLTDSAKVPVYKTEKITDTKANELTAINAPTRADYNFTGWYTADGKLFDVNKTAITEDITLHAGWEFDPNAPGCHPLTVTGGTVTVKYDGSDVTSKLNSNTDAATGKKTYSVPDGATVTVTLDKNAAPKDKVFDGWSTGDLSLPTGQDSKAESITFTMNSGVDIAAEYRDAATDHTPDTTVCHPLTVTGGTVTVKNGDKDVTNTLTVTTDETTGKKTYSVPDGATVTVTLDKTLIPEGMVFDIWSTGKFSLPLGQDYKAESITFTMNATSSDVDIAAQYRDASIEDDGPNVLGTAAIIGTAAVSGAVLGYQAYSLGAEFAGKLLNLPYFPSNRSALAMMLWEDAGKPMPESELLYPDVGQEERDMDLQHAARWAMENDLVPDLNDEGTAPEEMKFFPANPVSKLDVLNAWQKAQELKNN